MGEVCALPNRFHLTSKRMCIVPKYIILLSFIKIGQDLFEIIDINTHTHEHTRAHTHRHIHADENSTCPKTKFLGQVNISLDLKAVC